MGLISRRTTRLAWALLGTIAVAATVDGTWLVRQVRWNAAIESGAASADTGGPAEVRFAQAFAQAASGATEAALNRYGALQDESALGQAARYNSANLLMREGVALRTGAHPGQALAFIELAKENYREVLRRDPGRWDARYNLERAQRLVPDPEEVDLTAPDVKRNAERAATTMRGYSPGLP
jgi:mxaK protein